MLSVKIFEWIEREDFALFNCEKRTKVAQLEPEILYCYNVFRSGTQVDNIFKNINYCV